MPGRAGHPTQPDLVWDATTAEQAARTNATGEITLLEGVPVVATQGDQDTIVIRDVDTGTQLGAPLAGHQGALTALGVADLNGRPVLVSAAQDNTIRVWDLAVRVAG